jgi:hypothetical protein
MSISNADVIRYRSRKNFYEFIHIRKRRGP